MFKKKEDKKEVKKEGKRVEKVEEKPARGSQRPKPIVPKAGLTRNAKRRYCGGGKLK